ncbi:hypothetical protein BLNAU_16838 [Blattamonas nauphoetae]|uniref:Uncharacterized protein n=1 Tax=Blattamonas nauphoetae TaxID=2049346 RepID=A0ABQ9XBH7_9EUKA|nr:hypothetical protein BLNAU_16838 [Blattamonas nauphoetae]
MSTPASFPDAEEPVESTDDLDSVLEISPTHFRSSQALENVAFTDYPDLPQRQSIHPYSHVLHSPMTASPYQTHPFSLKDLSHAKDLLSAEINVLNSSLSTISSSCQNSTSPALIRTLRSFISLLTNILEEDKHNLKKLEICDRAKTPLHFAILPRVLFLPDLNPRIPNESCEINIISLSTTDISILNALATISLSIDDGEREVLTTKKFKLDLPKKRKAEKDSTNNPIKIPIERAWTFKLPKRSTVFQMTLSSHSLFSSKTIATSVLSLSPLETVSTHQMDCPFLSQSPSKTSAPQSSIQPLLSLDVIISVPIPLSGLTFQTYRGSAVIFPDTKVSESTYSVQTHTLSEGHDSTHDERDSVTEKRTRMSRDEQRWHF